MPANDTQVQTFVDTRIRPHAELARALELAFTDDIAAIDDVYQALSGQSPSWKDGRTDGPPHVMTPSDVLAFNSFMHDIRDAIVANPQYAIMRKACVRPALS